MDIPRPSDYHSAEDFLNDARFRRWARGEAPEDAARWQQWLDDHPDKAGLYQQAVATLLVIGGSEESAATNEEPGTEGSFIMSRHTASSFWTWTRWAMAAVLLLAVSFWFLPKNEKAAVPQTHAKPGQAQEAAWHFVKNIKNAPQLINLPDGSSVLLSKGSSLRYPVRMTGAKREVRLNGEGFFEVVKNPEQPFVVYAGTVVTRVLGTSFRVRSFAGQRYAEVAVKTGKVSVTTAAGGGDNNKLALTLLPDQQIRLSLDENEPLTTLPAPVPVTAALPIQRALFDFHFTPISEAFGVLEDSYGVTVHYDRQKMRHCTLTASLKDEPFLEKIRLICLATETTFRMDGGHVYIDGPGCP
ncbi:FecR family protein [Dyadobacter sandarakinus]|uniref:FecR domain-containing protein n=1 Tax=Dyadobacter sandarakinus TaxID=2747268 RepID=A0ABX7I7A9_9BACT|nr:FecR domain-containing protein [Dyadobacter sandarakinus]QRR01799.1 FecR domain-containing protein [Dyadobacter sandarakinus]